MHISSRLLICSFQLLVAPQMFVAVGVPGVCRGKNQLSWGVSSITGQVGGKGGRVFGFVRE